MGYQEFLLLAIVAVWAGVVWKVVSLARERGRNPWAWGIGAFILTSPGFAILPGVLLLIWLAHTDD